jgi:hypothetical protein
VSTLYQPSPILQFQRLFVRLSTLKHEREGLAGAVLATDTVSANADCDNGTMLRSTRGSQLRDGSLDDSVIDCLIVIERYRCEPLIEHSTEVPPNVTTGGRFIALVGC